MHVAKKDFLSIWYSSKSGMTKRMREKVNYKHLTTNSEFFVYYDRAPWSCSWTDMFMCSRIMCKNHAIMKREITINTPVVCGFAARPPSLARFILPRWESFVCSTLPSCVLTGRTVPQEFPRLFICDSFVRCRALPYRPKSSNPPIHPLARAAIPLGPPSRRWRLLDKISSLSHRESHWLPPSAFSSPSPSLRASCHQDTS